MLESLSYICIATNTSTATQYAAITDTFQDITPQQNAGERCIVMLDIILAIHFVTLCHPPMPINAAPPFIDHDPVQTTDTSPTPQLTPSKHTGQDHSLVDMSNFCTDRS